MITRERERYLQGNGVNADYLQSAATGSAAAGY